MSATKRKSDSDKLTPSDSPKHHQSSSTTGNEAPLSAIEKLPTNLLVKIIRYIPIGQWASLESVCPRFRACIFEAWNALKRIEIFDDLLATTKYFPRTYVNADIANLVFEKLSLRAPKLAEIGAFPKIDNDMVLSNVVKFEKLRRIEAADDQGWHFHDLATFLNESASRDQLLELVLPNAIDHTGDAHQMLADAFDNSELRKPLRLETLNLESHHDKLMRPWELQGAHLRLGPPSSDCLFLETMDVSRLTTFRIAYTLVPQRQLSDLIRRATSLRRLSFSFSCVTMIDTIRSEYRSTNLHGWTFDGIQSMRTANMAILDAIGTLEHLESLAITCSMLRSIKYCGCRSITSAMDELFRKLGDRPTFKKLALCRYMSDPVFVAPIADYLPQLESLALHAHESSTSKRVLRSQMSLRKLRLVTKPSSNDEGGKIELQDILHNAETLESLHLHINIGAVIVGDLKLLGQFQRLRKFRLFIEMPSGSDVPIDDSTLSEWASGFGSRLRSLELRRKSGWGPSITSNGFNALFSAACSLAILDLEGLDNADPVLEKLSTACLMLMELRLRSCEMVSKDAVQAVLDGCSRLKCMSLPVDSWTESWYPHGLRLDKYRRIRFQDADDLL